MCGSGVAWCLSPTPPKATLLSLAQCDYVTKPCLPFSLVELDNWKESGDCFPTSVTSPAPLPHGVVTQSSRLDLDLRCVTWRKLAKYTEACYKLYTKLVFISMKNTTNNIRSKYLPIQTRSSWDSGEENLMTHGSPAWPDLPQPFWFCLFHLPLTSYISHSVYFCLRTFALAP